MVSTLRAATAALAVSSVSGTTTESRGAGGRGTRAESAGCGQLLEPPGVSVDDHRTWRARPAR